MFAINGTIKLIIGVFSMEWSSSAIIILLVLFCQLMIDSNDHTSDAFKIFGTLTNDNSKQQIKTVITTITITNNEMSSSSGITLQFGAIINLSSLSAFTMSKFLTFDAVSVLSVMYDASCVSLFVWCLFYSFLCMHLGLFYCILSFVFIFVHIYIMS